MLGAISAGAFFSGIAANTVYAVEEDESITEAAEAKDIDEQTLLDEGVDEGGENKEDKKTIEGNNQYETINGGDSAIQTEKAEELQLTDEENVKTTKDGKPNTNWATKPVFMCVKVAKAQALREAFPNMFSNNTYTADEMPERDESMVIDNSAEFKESSVEEVKKTQKAKTAYKTVTPDSTDEWPE